MGERVWRRLNGRSLKQGWKKRAKIRDISDGKVLEDFYTGSSRQESGSHYLRRSKIVDDRSGADK